MGRFVVVRFRSTAQLVDRSGPLHFYRLGVISESEVFLDASRGPSTFARDMCTPFLDYESCWSDSGRWSDVFLKIGLPDSRDNDPPEYDCSDGLTWLLFGTLPILKMT